MIRDLSYCCHRPIVPIKQPARVRGGLATLRPSGNHRRSPEKRVLCSDCIDVTPLPFCAIAPSSADGPFLRPIGAALGHWQVQGCLHANPRLLGVGFARKGWQRHPNAVSHNLEEISSCAVSTAPALRDIQRGRFSHYRPQHRQSPPRTMPQANAYAIYPVSRCGGPALDQARQPKWASKK